MNTYRFGLIFSCLLAASHHSVTTADESLFKSFSYRVLDAEYSSSLDKIVMVSTTPSDQLYIHDPSNGGNVSVDLPLTPSSVSISPDGLFAAVGHDGWVSYINLTSGTIEKTISVPTDVLDVVSGGNGYAYAFPNIDQWTYIYSVNIDTEAVLKNNNYYIHGGTRARLHPGGNAIYGADRGISPSDIEKYGITSGNAIYLYDSQYHGDFEVCGDLWFSEDGIRIFTACGNVFQASDNQVEDMTYNGSLSEIDGLIQFVAHSSEASKVVVLLAEDTYTNNVLESATLQIYDDDFLNFNKTITLPMVDNFSTIGKFVFFNSNGSEYYVIAQVEESSGWASDYGIVTYTSLKDEPFRLPSTINECMVTYSPKDGSLTIPCVQITGDSSVTYRALLHLIDDNPMTFDLRSVGLKQ